jgi:tetratricopeptide (TPR) repeat protein
MPVRRLLGLVIVLGAVLLAGLVVRERGQPGDPAPREPMSTDAAFVGAASCGACHENEAALWSGSHHDLAMQAADASTVLGDFADATFGYAGTTSTFFTRGDAFMVRTDGPDGTLADFEVAFTFGADPLQQYLIARPGGRLQALSIAWDARPAADGGQRWFHLYPDEAVDHADVLHWTGPAQTWNFMCAECHSTDLDKRYSPGRDTYETTWSDLDVACEACHGPGSEHVAWAEAFAPGERPPDGVPNGLRVDLTDRDRAVWNVSTETGLATRSVPRTSHTALELCARCHSRRSVISDDYTYGRPLVETHRPALLTQDLYYPDGQIRDEVYVYGSFLQSRMYAAGVTCTDCHDPHALRVRGEGNARCAACHLPATFDTPVHHYHEAGTPGASCVECHMPPTTYMGVDPRRDHSFRRPRPDLSVGLGTPNACNACHADRSPEWAADAVDRWYGSERPGHYGEILHAARTGAPGASERLVSLASAVDQPAIVRATAVAELRAVPGPSTAAALARAVGDPDPLVRMAGAGAAEALPPEARLSLLEPLLDDDVRLVRTEAARVLAGVPDELLDEPQRTALTPALADYRRIQLVNADRAESHVNLGVLHVQRNELEEAERAYEHALRLNPSFVPAYANLADLYRVQARDDRVEQVLERGLAAVPDSGDLSHAIGLLRVRQGRRPEAVESLRRAAGLMPDVARYAYVYGVALNSTGRAPAALEVLDAAHRRHPDDVEILLALVTISRDVGAIETAREYGARMRALVPTDPRVAQLLSELEARR